MERIDHMKQHLNSIVEELKEHPIKYPLRRAGEFVRDYWDLAAAIAAGIAMCDNRGELLGDYITYRPHIINAGIFAGIMGPGIDFLVSGREPSMRFLRNFYGGMASFLTTLTGESISEGQLDPKKPADLGYLATNAFIILSTYLSDWFYRKENKPVQQQLQTEVQKSF